MRATASARGSQEGTGCEAGAWLLVDLGVRSKHCSHPQVWGVEGGESLFILQQKAGVGLAVTGR